MAKKKINWKIYIPLTVVILAVVTGAAWWYADYVKYVRTDDAYVDSDVVTVAPKVMGRIVAIYADEGDSVRSGQLLAVLDSTDLYAQKLQTEAIKLQSQSNQTQSIAKLDYDRENQKVLQVALNKAKDDYSRAKTQYDGGVITQEDYDHALKAYETAQAQFTASQAQLAMSKSQIATAISGVEVAGAQIDVINSQLKNYRLYAPCDGVVAKRWLLPGDIAQPAQSIFTINNTTKYRVQVFIEETKMEHIHIGDEALFTIDAYGDLVFKGKVYDIGSTTASQFSLIPPSNASGNFTKVTQRVPLKISIESVETDNGKTLADFPLLTGMSVVVKIKKD